MSAPFIPASVPISYTFNINQVALLLRGLNKLPREESEGFYESLQSHALQTVQAAEAQHQAQTASADIKTK